MAQRLVGLQKSETIKVDHFQMSASGITFNANEEWIIVGIGNSVTPSATIDSTKATLIEDYTSTYSHLYHVRVKTQCTSFWTWNPIPSTAAFIKLKI